MEPAYKNAKAKERRYKLANGNKLYLEPRKTMVIVSF
jgi:hypothetical protein